MSVTKDMSIIKDIMIALEFKAVDYYKISGKWPFWYDDAMAWLMEQYEQTSPVLSNSCKTGKDEKDERIRKELIEHIKSNCKTGFLLFQKFSPDDILAWLEKQGEQKPKKVSIWKHWKDGIAGNGEGKQTYLIKNGLTYSISSCLGHECDYIELSELNELMREEKQGMPKWTEEDDAYKLFVISAVEDYYDEENPLRKDLVAWLKSIKQRLEAQQ